MIDYYDILGVDRNASQDEIKKKFKKAAVKWHPDRWTNKSDDERKHAEEMFKQVNEANDVLSDPDKRARYDQYGENWDKVGGGMDDEDFGFGGFGDIFRHFAGMGGFSRRERDMSGAETGQTIRARIAVNIEDIFNGDTRELNVNVKKRCTECHGTGGEKETCPCCNGTGMVSSRRTFGNQILQTTSPCPHCHGTGHTYKTKCSKCGGTGFSTVQETVKVNIRPGIENGEEIVFHGMGYESSNPKGMNGDLIVQCVYNIDSTRYIVQGNNVYERISVPYYDCIVGKEMTVTLPNGRTKTLKIPKYCKDGQQVILYGESFNHGNYIFVISCTMPDRVSNEEMKLLEQIQKIHN